MGRRHNSSNPSPDRYNPDYTVESTLANKPKWGFGSSKRGSLNVGKTEVPGSGTYHIPQKAVEGTKWTMGKRWDDKNALNHAKQVPGPGGYDPNYRNAKKVDPAFSMGSRLTA